MSTQPLNSATPQGPVEGRPVAEIRADLATCEQLAIVPWPAAASRLLADVPALLAEVEAAHRFERSVAVESAGLVNTLNGVAAERDALRGVVRQIREVRGCLGAGPMDYEAFVDEIDRALAAAADAPQTEPATAQQRYDQARRDGLSEHEARAVGWPGVSFCGHTVEEGCTGHGDF